MDAEHKKIALRMIPYGLYILTGEDEQGRVAAATVNWVTQASFEPPLVVVAVKKESLTHEIIKSSGSFALNILAKGQEDIAYTFLKSLERDGNSIGGKSFSAGECGSPIFETVPAYVECRLHDTVEIGDHSVFVGEVVNAGVRKAPAGRPEETTLTLKDLGERVYYGG